MNMPYLENSMVIPDSKGKLTEDPHREIHCVPKMKQVSHIGTLTSSRDPSPNIGMAGSRGLRRAQVCAFETLWLLDTVLPQSSPMWKGGGDIQGSSVLPMCPSPWLGGLPGEEGVPSLGKNGQQDSRGRVHCALLGLGHMTSFL